MCPKLIELLSWNGPTVHVCCFMLARSSSKTFVSRVQKKTAKKIFVSRKIRQQGHSLAEVSLYYVSFGRFLVNRSNTDRTTVWDIVLVFLVSFKAETGFSKSMKGFRSRWQRSIYGVGLRPLLCWDCWFESHRELDIFLL